MIRICLLAATLACAVSPASAADAHWVTGVAPDDVLYMRAEPSAASPIVGALPPGARGVLIEEQRADGWGLAAYRETKGWVALRYLSPDPSETAALPEALTCSGTEPFWSVRLDGVTAVYADPEGEARAEVVSRQSGRNRSNLWLVALRGAPIGALTIVRDGACSDGMSDAIHEFTAYAQTSEGLAAGCCRR